MKLCNSLKPHLLRLKECHAAAPGADVEIDLHMVGPDIRAKARTVHFQSLRAAIFHRMAADTKLIEHVSSPSRAPLSAARRKMRTSLQKAARRRRAAFRSTRRRRRSSAAPRPSALRRRRASPRPWR